jgi:hypothetical protein
MATMAPPRGEILQERSKGKDVRTSNIVAAKVSSKDYESNVVVVDVVTDDWPLADERRALIFKFRPVGQ